MASGMASALDQMTMSLALTKRPVSKPEIVMAYICLPLLAKVSVLNLNTNVLGAIAYMAAWDVHRAKVFGICTKSTGIESYHRLVDLVMRQEPYRSANRVFWITDNGSSHRGQTSVKRLTQWHPNAVQVHTPVHASWLNQIEIYFSIVQRKILTPNDFPNLSSVENCLLDFQAYYEQIAKPFNWKFNKKDLLKMLGKIEKSPLVEFKKAA